ncbi:dead deah box dna helicase [Ophiostoma piceae UAMH 11346]|uniref:Dead deah box dna helicase n=1 Tax=Ophiostoma piceae (strain UAMH 11346) TaxID=1262450 RepID=S3BUA6_OPHP1|nr:dead deah box dna helicase [Ophiostoma piceae UAMH 11346]
MAEEAPPDILFTDIPSVFARLANLAKDEDTLVVGDVSPSSFRALEAERDRRCQHFRLFYQPDTECVVVTVPNLQHSQMHIIMYEFIRDTMVTMGVHRGWRPIGDTTFNTANGSSGQGDSAGSPKAGRNADDWPTLVVEAGFSQTLPSLRAKMRWWFAASHHRVKVVILIKMQLTQETLHIEKWLEMVGRPGATATRSATRSATRAGLAVLQPICNQAIDLEWTGPRPIRQTPAQGRLPHLFRVTGGPLVIEFADIFLRAPAAGEHDIVISDQNLQLYASEIWEDLL